MAAATATAGRGAPCRESASHGTLGQNAGTSELLGAPAQASNPPPLRWGRPRLETQPVLDRLRRAVAPASSLLLEVELETGLGQRWLPPAAPGPGGRGHKGKGRQLSPRRLGQVRRKSCTENGPPTMHPKQRFFFWDPGGSGPTHPLGGGGAQGDPLLGSQF